jgi:1,4-alpha-glucan branching enzyme
VIVCACNFNPDPKRRHRIGLPRPGRWVEALNSDSRHYGGGDLGNLGAVEAEPIPWHGQPCSAEVLLPPLAVLWFAPEPR